MTDKPQPMSRRGLFRALVKPLSRHLEAETPESSAPTELSEEPQESPPMQAVIQGRFCLAYQGGICFTCSERCPVPGAITTKRGIPTVHADICTGCRVCHDLCPAPRNAILMVESLCSSEE